MKWNSIILENADSDNEDGIEFECNFMNDDLYTVDFGKMLKLHLTSTRPMQSVMILVGEIPGLKSVAK
ncbi:hypothetical protein AHAS_Ahas09G0158300 [Arachis hypogaea]